MTIELSGAQRTLLAACIEAEQKNPGQEFLCKPGSVEHPGFVGGKIAAADADLLALVRARFIQYQYGLRSSGRFTLTRSGLYFRDTLPKAA